MTTGAPIRKSGNVRRVALCAEDLCLIPRRVEQSHSTVAYEEVAAILRVIGGHLAARRRAVLNRAAEIVERFDL